MELPELAGRSLGRRRREAHLKIEAKADKSEEGMVENYL